MGVKRGEHQWGMHLSVCVHMAAQCIHWWFLGPASQSATRTTPAAWNPVMFVSP